MNSTIPARIIWWRNPPDRSRGHYDWHTFYAHGNLAGKPR